MTRKHAIVFKDPSLAVQSQRDEADINTIVRNFGITGRLPQSIRLPSFGDFSGISDYQSALNAINEAENSFYQIPAKVRETFDNDPQKFIEFCENKENLPQLREWGLAPTPEAPPAPAPDQSK